MAQPARFFSSHYLHRSFGRCSRARPALALEWSICRDHAKVHLTPIPLLGGLAMYAAVVIAVLFAFNGPAPPRFVDSQSARRLSRASGSSTTRVAHHQVKLFVGMPLAARSCWSADSRAVFSVLVADAEGFPGPVLTGCFGSWGLRLRSASSITWTPLRGRRGYGIRLFCMLAYLNGQTLVTTLAAAVLGAAAGFLRWNFKPAKIFMGDGGAMFLGYL